MKSTPATTDRQTQAKIIWRALKRAQRRMVSFTLRWGQDTSTDRLLQRAQRAAWHRAWLEEGNKVRRELRIRFPPGGPHDLPSR